MNNTTIPRCVPTKGTLRRTLKKAIFGGDGRPRCPHCMSYRIKSIKREERWRCKDCHHPFSIKSCTSLLKYSKLELEVIWLLLHCWIKKYSLELAQDRTGLSYPTVRSWYQKFRDHIPQERIDTLLEDDVCADEMFTRKRVVMGAKQKGTRNIALYVLNEKDPNKSDAVAFLERFTKANINLFTDGSGIYKGIEENIVCTHTYERHNRFEFALTAEIEGLWACFRTFIRQMYHHVTTDYLPDLACEFALRFRRDEIFDSPRSYFMICLSSKPFAL